MRTFIIILCIVVIAVVGVAIYLVVTTPNDARPLHFPLSEAQVRLLSHVPAEAEAFALVPAPVVLMNRLLENPVTREPVAKWTDEHPLPPAAMLGRADAVAWRSGKTTSYAVRFDPVRALIVRTWTMFTSIDTHWEGRTLIINGTEGGTGSSAPPEIALAAGLPEGDAFVVQRQESRGAFPPIGRPAVSSVSISAKEINITSRAASGAAQPVTGAATAPQLPVSAMLSVSFTEAPRVLGDLDRLLGADLDALTGNGGTIAVYGVDTGTLLPRPFAAVVVPADETSRAAVAKYENVLASLGTVQEAGGQLVVSFDRNSAHTYIKDAKAPLPFAASRWGLRMDPAKLIPVLRKVGDNPALRFATPRIHRGARDLRRWIGAFQHAESVEAAASAGPGFEELRVRVASK